MRSAIICSAGLILGFVSGNLVAIPFFNSVSFTTPVPITKTPIIPDCGSTGQPECIKATPIVPIEVTSTPPDSSPPIEINFETPVTYRAGETMTYTDGLMVTLTAIIDSRCQSDVHCIWAGELSPQISLTGGDFKDTLGQLSLGTSRPTSQTIGAYTVTLETATEYDTTIIITKENVVRTTTKPTPTVAETRITQRHIAKPASSPPAVPATAVSASAFGAEVALRITAATNKLRQNEFLPTFSADRTLAASAKKYSSRLLANNYLSHVDKNGCDLTCRFTESGYRASSWGENLAMMEYDERPSAEYVANFFMTQWQKSAGHRKNLLSDTFTYQGVGVSVIEGKVYVVVHFALPQ